MKFSEWICMPMTPSRKDENVIYAKKVTEILFLKRVPLYNDVLKRYVGVLDIGSIGKMLAFTDSYANDWERSVRDQARRELAFHGEELYYKYFKVLNEPVKPIDETLKEIDHLVWGKTNFDLVSEEAYRAVSGLVDNKFDIYPDCGKDVTDILRFKDQSGSSVAQQTCKKSFCPHSFEKYALSVQIPFTGKPGELIEDIVDGNLPILQYYHKVLHWKMVLYIQQKNVGIDDTYLLQQIGDLENFIIQNEVQQVEFAELANIAIQSVMADVD
jgi:hypothetical protein